MVKVGVAFLVVASVLVNTSAQSEDQQGRIDPYGCLGAGDKRSLDQIRKEVATLKSFTRKTALNYCAIAELLKRLGDYEAEDYYRKAISADESEPAYEMFFADYLRNFRGALHPLFSEAEKHYFEAQRKLNGIKDKTDVDRRTSNRLERGLVALYQEDGVPLAELESGAPFWFLASINKYANMLGDFDRVDEVRSFTSEALFAASGLRLNRQLTEDELQRIIRSKPQYETLDRFRFRYKGMPALEVFYKGRGIEDAQITNFFEPNKFNDVRLNEYGFAAEKSISVGAHFDLFLRGAINRIDRKGIVEFLPDVHEDINQYEGNIAFSRFAGPDKVNMEYTIVHQDINEDRPNPLDRKRTIQGGRFTYQVFRPIGLLQGVYENRFETRGVDLFTGFLHDREAFGQVDVTHKDFFFGASVKGIGSKGRIDVNVQPTILTSTVEGDPSQNNSQYRTNASLLYRIVDEERAQGQEVDPSTGSWHLAFLHLVVPFKHDLAIGGPKNFENFRIGAGLDSKFFTAGSHRTSFLLSGGYDYQRFFNLNRSRNLFSFTLSMGF